jgi:hypothetical protein
LKKEIEGALELAFEQMQEDRKTIKESYDKFAAQIHTLEDYAVSGMNLNKCLELLTKQTAQLLELGKIQGAGKKKSGSKLDPDEIQETFAQFKDSDGYQ